MKNNIFFFLHERNWLPFITYIHTYNILTEPHILVHMKVTLSTDFILHINWKLLF